MGQDDLVEEDMHRDVQWQRGHENVSHEQVSRVEVNKYLFMHMPTTCGHITEGHRFPFEQRS